jgi:thiamine transporter ThiT
VHAGLFAATLLVGKGPTGRNERTMSVAKMLPNKMQCLILMGCLALAAGVGLANSWMGWQISCAIFYLLPIYIAVSHVGRWSGIFLAVLCGLTWMAVDTEHIDRYADPWVCYWNGLAMLGFFTIFAMSIASLESALQREKSINSNLQALLTLAPYEQQGWQLPTTNPPPSMPDEVPH